MIYTAGGVPASPELDRMVHRIDDGLSLRFFAPVGMPPYWGVMFRWPQTDRRWIEVREGRVPESEALDMIVQLPPDCPPDQARSFIESRCRDWGKAGRDDIAKLVTRCQEYNQRQQQKNQEPLMEYVDEMLDANARTLLSDFGKTTARVFQSDNEGASSTKGKRRAKAKLLDE